MQSDEYEAMLLLILRNFTLIVVVNKSKADF